MLRQFRHGDVLLEEIDELPSELHEKNDGIVAHGEATGHAHRLVGHGRLLQDSYGSLFITAVRGVAIVHEEHLHIEIPPANYRVIRQREWEPNLGSRYVVD